MTACNFNAYTCAAATRFAAFDAANRSYCAIIVDAITLASIFVVLLDVIESYIVRISIVISSIISIIQLPWHSPKKRSI